MLQDDAALVAQVLVGTVKAPVASGRVRPQREVAHVLAHTQEPTTDVEGEGSGIEVTQESVTDRKTNGRARLIYSPTTLPHGEPSSVYTSTNLW